MIVTQPPDADPPITIAMDLIARYAVLQGWVPIGYRSFTVGKWDITVNGTKNQVGLLPPWHAQVEHQDIVAILVFDAHGGTAGGWNGAEQLFLADMEAAIVRSDG